MSARYGPIVYVTFEAGDETVAGAMRMPDEVPAEAPAHWSVGFAVADCLATERRALELGGTVLAPTAPGGGGHFAVLEDPQGATFQVLEPSP